MRALDLETLQLRLRSFAQERDWEKFHKPKNLAMALAGECGELVSELQWLTESEAAVIMGDAEARERIEGELADVGSYLLRLCDVLEVDLIKAIQAKIEINEHRYPVHAAFGSARKYDQIKGS